MDASRKRARTGSSTSAEDRLSALPDALIHTIMSFLKARQVVQTCVLAKRWRHLWRSVPYLDIDLAEFNSKVSDGAAIEARYPKFVDFADYLLFHRQQDGSLLDTFRLQLHAVNSYGERRVDAVRWVRRGLKCSPRVFHFQNDHTSRYDKPGLPLELGSGPPSSSRLTKLHLLGLSLNCSFADQISSVCHLLEDLELKNCLIGFQKISSPSLKILVIDCCCAQYRSEPNNQLILAAPHLTSLHLNLEAEGVFVVSLNEMVSLVKAFIHKRISYPADVVHDNQCKLLSSLSNVTSLKLLGFCERLVPDEEPVEFPTFKNLTDILLDNCELGDKFQLLRYFLQNSPNLEKLIVKRCQFSKGSKRGKGKAKSKTGSKCQDVVQLSSLKLKYIGITYKSRDNIGPLVNVLLDVSDRLPKNTSIRLTKV